MSAAGSKISRNVEWIVDKFGTLIGYRRAHQNDVYVASLVTNANGDTTGILSGVDTIGIRKIASANTVVLAGDSLSAAGWSTVGNTYMAVNMNGFLVVADALLGHPFEIIGSVAVGGANHAGILTSQMPAVAGLSPKHCYIGSPYNDIYTLGATGANASDATIALIEYLIERGISPIWHTVHARTFDSVQLKQHIDCNNRLKDYAASTTCGIWWDAFKVNVNHLDPNCEPRAGWTYDGPIQVHPNRTQGYYQALALAAACKARGLERSQTFSYGAENQANTATGQSNLLANPNFGTATGGTASTGVTGTVPANWTVDWSTRTGTGTAAVALVDITDPDTGLVVAKGIQLTITGPVAANDAVRITQDTGFNTLLSGGDLVSAEGILTIASPVGVQQMAMRVLTNNTESTWWGTAIAAAGGTIGDIPAGDTFYARTRKMTVLGAGAATQARYDARLIFSAANATGVFTLSNPKVRKG